ncbi:vegetative incompatibility protein het-e-1 [Paraphaeosphaeria minitans]|uniref:Vegetative incompatibility protein het-e-1 n=1 Tax=Paraphaeosphaeria minitans TaxID=565426 RepID=A0A9P6G3Y1_9PLEO|nr:vegetative incompatibility protein het-e-1 [Paraphaeosphaeria minitans]
MADSIPVPWTKNEYQPTNQPTNIAVFGPLKAAYRDQVERLPARETAMSRKNILAGWAKAGLFPFNPDRVLRSLAKPLVPLSVRSEGIKPCLSHEVPSHGVLHTPITPVSSEALSSLLTLIRQDLHDEPSRRRHQKLLQKLANAAQTSFAQQALDQDHIQFLSNMNNEAKPRRKTKSEILGKARVMSYEDIEAARAKRAEHKAATEAKGKRKRGRKPKRSATTTDGSLEATVSADAGEASQAVEDLHIAAAEGTIDEGKSHTKRKRARRETEEAIAGRAKRSRNGETPTLEPATAAEMQTIGRGLASSPDERLMLLVSTRLPPQDPAATCSYRSPLRSTHEYAPFTTPWGQVNEEVTLEDIIHGTGRDKAGYRKIQLCAEQAVQDGLEYFWVDTCCIDKENYAELSQAINSMFRWYRDAARCYVYLSDVYKAPPNNECGTDPSTWDLEFRKSEWFSRGWTLQELLAPSMVEFFSQHWEKIGDKTSLKRQIHEITGIPISALQGERLSSFSDYERFSWMERRQTKKAVDRAYALLGVFDVDMMLNYDEGVESALRRLQEEVDKRKRCLQNCLQDLRPTDPRDDKKRIEDTKGGLLKDAYRWVLQNAEFRQWCENQHSRLLWIKGDPGKGKTMLLCGIVDELEESTAWTALVAYFFFQATDSRINSATAVLPGLLYLLIDQQPSLVSHIQAKHDHAGKALFEDANAWVALREIFTNILRDPGIRRTHLIVDALDECVVDREKLLDFIVEQSSTSSRVKWIVSSRNWPEIEQRLSTVGHGIGLSLELNAESVATAVDVFIQQKVIQLSQSNKYNAETREAVRYHLSSNANGTFLWVALVCQGLKAVPKRHVRKKLSAFPSGLDSLYEQMVQHLVDSDDADLCKKILALAAIVYRPLTLQEMVTLVEQFEDAADDPESVQDIIGRCGSFLTTRDSIVYFVHQSAKDLVFEKAAETIFPSGIEDAHYAVFYRSLQVLSDSLQRDMYNLGAPGYPIERVVMPDPDPLLLFCLLGGPSAALQFSRYYRTS